MVQKFKAVLSRRTHEGRTLECFGFSEKPDGGVTLMRWVQTPYQDLATPPVIFDMSQGEWMALLDVVREKTS